MSAWSLGSRGNAAPPALNPCDPFAHLAIRAKRQRLLQQGRGSTTGAGGESGSAHQVEASGAQGRHRDRDKHSRLTTTWRSYQSAGYSPEYIHALSQGAVGSSSVRSSIAASLKSCAWGHGAGGGCVSAARPRRSAKHTETRPPGAAAGAAHAAACRTWREAAVNSSAVVVFHHTPGASASSLGEGDRAGGGTPTNASCTSQCHHPNCARSSRARQSCASRGGGGTKGMHQQAHPRGCTRARSLLGRLLPLAPHERLDLLARQVPAGSLPLCGVS